MSDKPRAALLSFSDRGAETARRLADILASDYSVSLHTPKGTLKQTTAELFACCSAIVFVGSCGIAVRAIAPYVVSKTTDPAVLVCDECGGHIISLLSGHIGGANALTRRLAAAIGADPVITTATDVNHRFSVDAWAAEQGLQISSMQTAKHFSAEILKRDLPLYSEFPIRGEMPAGVYPGSSGTLGVYVGIHTLCPFAETLRLVPRAVYLGLGCRRGTPESAISEAVVSVLSSAEIPVEAIAGIASIDVKQDEAGLLSFAASRGIPVRFASAAELNALPGSFTGSEFVKKTVGVDNVCERAAVWAAGSAVEPLLRKTALNGVTVAAAIGPVNLKF